MANLFSRKSEKGQGLVEYTLLFVLIAIPLIAVLTPLGPQIKTVFTEIMAETTGGITVEDGVVNIPGLSPSLTPNPTTSPTPIVTFTPTTLPTPTELACTPGNASNVPSRNACKDLRNSNNCENFSYSGRNDTCSWD